MRLEESTEVKDWLMNDQNEMYCSNGYLEMKAMQKRRLDHSGLQSGGHLYVPTEDQCNSKYASSVSSVFILEEVGPHSH